MAAAAVDIKENPAGPAAARSRRPPATGLGLGFATLYLSIIVFIPLAAIILKSQDAGWSVFWASITAPQAWAALKLTIGISLAVTAVNVVMGTLLAWVLVRDDFFGKRVFDTLIDLPFALPTIVAGLVLLSLYGSGSPVGVNIAYTRLAVGVALAFVTLPFVVRTVQPVLLEIDKDMEEAAASLGASRFTTFRRVVLPNLYPAIAAGAALSFARAISEFGSTVLISGNLPFKTQVAAVHIFGQIESDNVVAAASVSTALLVVSFVVLTGIDVLQRWGVKRG